MRRPGLTILAGIFVVGASGFGVPLRQAIAAIKPPPQLFHPALAKPGQAQAHQGRNRRVSAALAV
jgi:hypothetical protein